MKNLFSLIVLTALWTSISMAQNPSAETTAYISSEHLQLSSFGEAEIQTSKITQTYNTDIKNDTKQNVKRKKKKDMNPQELAAFKAERKEKRKKFWSTVGTVVLAVAAVATITYLSLEEAEQARLDSETESDRVARQNAEAALAQAQQMTPTQQQQMVNNMDATTQYYYYMKQQQYQQQQGGQSGQSYQYQNRSDLTDEEFDALLRMQRQDHESMTIHNYNIGGASYKYDW